ncbi:DE-cadherin [Hyalella azteca]|uniref:DE-cadherin n=1 Tax=Hyalella azteca TaxID=294128 RepID=A0A979FR39_HYAAZ|nr:DE-cadherin [Hyalella azteca]
MHLPKFRQKSYKATIDENAPVSSSVMSVYATDDDIDENGIVEYVSSDSHFGVDHSGLVYVKEPLDYESSGGRYMFLIYARNPGTAMPMWAQVPVSVVIRDTREAPEFDSPSYNFAISEFSLQGEYVGRVIAWDPERSLVTYSLAMVSPPNHFVVDAASGIISVGERGGSDKFSYTFQAVATDEEGASSTVPVSVKIIAYRISSTADENTHPPVFTECQSYQNFMMKENQTDPANVIIVKATDRDQGVHGQVTYSFLGNIEDFVIDERSGQISTTAPLDRDMGRKEYFMTVVARDGGSPPLEGSCSFEVILEDINDNVPVFDQPSYSQDIPADSETHVNLLRVTASDADSGVNAVIQYSISGGDDYFTIQPDSGYIKLVRPLSEDMANVRAFSLSVQAKDMGTPALSSSASVRINVVGSDQVAPSVVERDPSPQVRENATIGTIVAQLCATSNTDNRDDVYFTLFAGNTPSMNGDGTFDIRKDGTASCPLNTVGAVIYVAVANMDYEVITAYKLIVQVSNSNARIDHSLTVRVLDVNDEMPLLQHPFSGVISENSDPNSLIMTATAIDKDVSPEFKQLRYSIKADAPVEVRTNFRVDPNTGDIWTLHTLDREKKRSYGVPIEVTDGAPGHNRHNLYWITINDVNDEPPTFNLNLGVYNVMIPEDLEIGKDTGIQLVVDDLDDVNEFNYQIISGNEADKFAIDAKTGTVTVNKKLDYDSPVNDRMFEMSVTVSDGRSFDTTGIKISVTNVNDLRPVFLPHTYNISVVENQECDVQKVQVRAYDPDLPAEQEDQGIRYYLDLEQTRNFTIDRMTGWVSVRGCLDREATFGGTEIINPRADDGGGKGINAEPGVINVNIIDVNDNHPYIKVPDNSRARVRENLPPANVPPIPILLDDADAPEHGCPCTLEFHHDVDPLMLTLFRVERDSVNNKYQLIVQETLDREKQKRYLVPFVTSDSQNVSGLRHLTIEVDDVNDNPMTDGSGTITVYNYETSFVPLGKYPDIVIGNVYVTDADDHDSGDKTFEVDPMTAADAEEQFQVKKETGNITMKAGTKAGTYTLFVRVTDHARSETAIGRQVIQVVTLPERAVRQSGSFIVAGTTAHDMVNNNGNGPSLYQRLRTRLASVFGVATENMDVFSITEAEGGVLVRYNCHGSPYFTEPRLNGILLSKKSEVEKDLGIVIPLVDTDKCLYESLSPCSNSSCNMELRINSTHPAVFGSGNSTVVSIQVDEYYACTCSGDHHFHGEDDGDLCECLNGGKCLSSSNPTACTCPDKVNYGPKCELLSARMNKGFSWFSPLDTCERSSLSLSFESSEEAGILLYNGPIVAKPYFEYPKDFVYIYFDNTPKVVAYLELGTGTMVLSVPFSQVQDVRVTVVLEWGNGGVTLTVRNCSATDPCEDSKPLLGDSPSFLFNTGGPLQLGGMASMPSFATLAQSYGWSVTPKSMPYFTGCLSSLQFNDQFYDLNATDYFANFHPTCAEVKMEAVVQLGAESIVIIIVSLLLLLMLLLLLLLLARRSKRQPSYPDHLQFVNQTMGASNLEGFEEKDATKFDLNMLRVTPDGQLLSAEKVPRAMPDVTYTEPLSRAPLAHIPEGWCVGDYIEDSLQKLHSEPESLDNVRHYCYEGDDMSIASLSSLSSGTSDGDQPAHYDEFQEWGPKFERLHQLYGQDNNAESDSEFDFPPVPKDAARQYRRARFYQNRPSRQEPAADLRARSPQPYQRLRDIGGGEGPLYHESVNPLADVYSGGAESWC